MHQEQDNASHNGNFKSLTSGCLSAPDPRVSAPVRCRTVTLAAPRTASPILESYQNEACPVEDSPPSDAAKALHCRLRPATPATYPEAALHNRRSIIGAPFLLLPAQQFTGFQPFPLSQERSTRLALTPSARPTLHSVSQVVTFTRLSFRTWPCPHIRPGLIGQHLLGNTRFRRRYFRRAIPLEKPWMLPRVALYTSTIDSTPRDG